MLAESVSTPRYCTAPRSLRHSIRTSATPAASAGRAMGNATAQNAAGRRAPERARHFQHAHRLLHEARARRQVDIRIEHRREHQDGAAQRADVGKHVVAGAREAEQRRAAPTAPDRHSRAVRRRRRRRCRSAWPAAAPAAGRRASRPGKRYMVTSHARRRADHERHRARAGEQQQRVRQGAPAARSQRDAARCCRPARPRVAATATIGSTNTRGDAMPPSATSRRRVPHGVQARAQHLRAQTPLHRAAGAPRVAASSGGHCGHRAMPHFTAEAARGVHKRTVRRADRRGVEHLSRLLQALREALARALIASPMSLDPSSATAHAHSA